MVDNVAKSIIKAAIQLHKKDGMGWQAIVDSILASVAVKAPEVRGAEFIKNSRARAAAA